MFAVKTRLYPLFAALLLLACASASKRYEQGLELETQGQYEGATARYAQALEKDPNHSEARARLQESGEAAIAQRLEDADDWASRNQPVSAANQYHRADTVRNRARAVGVRLELPTDYNDRRRDAFDEAIDALMASGDNARTQGRWQDGVAAYRQARDDYEADDEQRSHSLAGEAGLLVDWSETEYAQGRLRGAYEVASRVQELEWSPLEEANRAIEISEHALFDGEVSLLVLPIQSRAKSLRDRQQDRTLLREIDMALQAGPWQMAPPFVNLHDPIAVRDLISHSGLLDGGFEAPAMAAILRLAEADYGARLQLLNSSATEYDVRSTTRSVKTKDGRSVQFVQEEGKRRVHAEARVAIIDDFGNVVSDLAVTGTGSAPFSRGVYEGKASELSLTRQQLDLFDRFAQEAQLRAAYEALARDLAVKLADATYAPVLAQVP